MAVPISPIDLSDVIAEIGLSSDATLEDCVNNANSGGFDSGYQSSSDPLSAPYDLLDFRNYTHEIDYSISANPTSLSFGSSADTKYVDVDTGGYDYVIQSVNGSWITAQHYSSTQLKVSVDFNFSGSRRYGDITLAHSKDSSETVIIMISQDA